MKNLNTILNWKLLLVVALVQLSFTSCKDDDDNGAPAGNDPLSSIYEIASGDSFTTLKTAIDLAGLDATLNNDGPFTVFAPTNEAFAKVDQTTLANILADKDMLTKLLQYHVVSGTVLSGDLSSGEVATLLGENITVDVSGAVKINDATVTTADVEAANGVVHVINEVLLPPSFVNDMPSGPMNTITELAIASPDFSILVEILTKPEMSDLLAAASDSNSTLTVFAPTNTAFTNLLSALGKSSLDDIPTAVLREIVEYHIVGSVAKSTDLTNGTIPTLLDGESVTVDLSNGVMIDDSKVINADIEATNGVIHGIDAVLLPSFVIEALGTIAEVPMFNNDYSILYAALQEAELLSTIATTDDITVFAPNNAAFAAAGITSLDGLDKEALTPILLYHVRAGAAKKADVATLLGQPIEMLNMQSITVTQNQAQDELIINGDENTILTGFDIEKSNGVIHTISKTLIPAS